MTDMRNIVILTGAGISAESGIDTFRDAGGLWEQHRVEDVATPEGFARDPDLVLRFYDMRREAIQTKQPNPAHEALARLDRDWDGELLIVTQNVDDLHERAGSRDVLHLHGSLHHPRCSRCAAPFELAPAPPVEATEGRRLAPPRCLQCGGAVRPGIVWFGESLPVAALETAFAAAADCDLLLSVGTSGVVYPAAQVPEIALHNGATVVHVNPDPQALGGTDEWLLAGAAGEILPALLQAAFQD